MSKPQSDKDIHIPDEILKELLTSSEMLMLKNRYQIIKLLSKGLSIRAVALRAKVGTDTVLRVSRMISKEKRERLVKSEAVSQNTSSTYVFGKSRI